MWEAVEDEADEARMVKTEEEETKKRKCTKRKEERV